MQVDYLIVGQGICGTMLSWEFSKRGLSFLVMDDHDPHASSRVAAGMINPVTGRRIVKTWMIDTLLPFSFNAYREIGSQLGIPAIAETPIIDFFPTLQMRAAFVDRAPEIPEFLQMPAGDPYSEFFRYSYGYGIIAPAYTVNTRALLPAWRARIRHSGQLLEESFEPGQLELVTGGVRYKGIDARRIIFCNGQDAAGYPWFRNLPFASNKGQALILEINGLNETHIYARGLKLLPIGPNLFWAGSSYEWDFSSPDPTADFRDHTLNQLNDWLRVPFKLVDHVAALRPATLERRPFVGFHPHHPVIGIFNGMGTKGFSLAPYFANQFAEHIVAGTPIDPAAGVGRFTKLLARS